MFWMFDTKSKRRLATIAVLSAMFGLGSFMTTARAEERHWDHHDRRDWHGGYYRAPPVVYGSPYYAPPPVVYGAPGFGINLNIR
jgi:hypothetical protein